MARKYGRKVARRSSRNWMKHLGLYPSGSNKANRRRAAKYRRSKSYWKQHNNLLFSKVILRDVEKIWLGANAPTARIYMAMVENPHTYPRFVRGLWDGQVVYVQFTNPLDAERFKSSMWNFRS